MTKPNPKQSTKAKALRKLREAKAVKPAKAMKKAVAKPKTPAKKPSPPIKAFADLGNAVTAVTPRSDKLRPDAVALNLLIWDTAELEAGKVTAIASSFRETGTQISRITIRPAGAKKFRVVAGRHRCEAAKQVGWSELKYELLPYATPADKLNAELIEIDENLCRKNLSPATEAALTARRKAIYEKMHPETRAGVSQAAGMNASRGRQNGDDVNELFGESEKAPAATRFTEATAVTAGRSERSVQRAASRGEAIGADNLMSIAHTSLDKGEELDALAKLEPAERKDVIARAAAGEKVSAKTELKKQTRNAREQALGDLQLAFPTKRYGVIVEDFEWDDEGWSRETGMDRHASNHYPVAEDAHTPEEIVERTKDRFACAADDCFLAMWSTIQHLAIAIDVLRLRGFRYASHHGWAKEKIGLGRWVREKHDILLFGVKGKIPCPAPGTQWDSWQIAARGEHSAKPDYHLEMIRQYFPTLPKIILNHRGPAPEGFDVWGNEAIAATPQEAPAESTAAVPQAELVQPGEPAMDGGGPIILTELEALETIDNERTLEPEWLTKLKAEKLVRGSVKPMLTKLGIARVNALRLAQAHDAIERDGIPQADDALPADHETFGNISKGVLRVLTAIERGEAISFNENDHVIRGLYTQSRNGKLKLTPAGVEQLANLRNSASSPPEVEQSSSTTSIDGADRGGAGSSEENDIPSDAFAENPCRVCGTGGGICAQCLPAEGHTVRHTNPDGIATAECLACGWKHTMPWGGHHAEQAAAVKAHWQSVVDEARAADGAPAAMPEALASQLSDHLQHDHPLEPIGGRKPDDDGLGIPAFLQREPAE